MAHSRRASTPDDIGKAESSHKMRELCSRLFLAPKSEKGDNDESRNTELETTKHSTDYELQVPLCSQCMDLSDRRSRTLSESELAVGDLTLNDNSDLETSVLDHSGRVTPSRTRSYRIKPRAQESPPLKLSTGCLFQLRQPITKEQACASYCILTFDEPFLRSDDCRETEDGVCKAEFVLHIQDTQADGEKDAGLVRLKTLPKQLGIGQSNLRKSKLGVFAREDLPKQLMFGPMFGRNRPTIECSFADKCCRKVLKKVNKAADIDTTQEKGNWMGFIKYTDDVKHTNLSAFIHGEYIYYKTTAPIKRSTELVLNSTCDDHFTSSSILVKAVFE